MTAQTASASAAAAVAPHIPVLAEEVVHALAVAPGETHVDGTFGAGGYAKAILEKGAARVIAFDRDPDAIQAGESLAASSGGRLALVPERFSRMRQALAARGIDQVDGVTLDIGVSSMQLDQAERGFSFQGDGPLDMRMAREGASAADFVNHADESEIADVHHDAVHLCCALRRADVRKVGEPVLDQGQPAIGLIHQIEAAGNR